MHPFRFIGCFLLVAGLARGQAPATDELLTEAEIRALDRENAMWRLANPDEGLAANVARLRQAGYTNEEIATLQPRLAAMWTVPFERNFGWLRPETVERIRAIDHEFVGRMRAAHLLERTGVRSAGGPRESTVVVNRLWRVAIVHALGNGELTEFQLNNSTAARQEARFARGLQLTADEQRTLFEWRRDYDGRHGPSLGTVGVMSDWQREMFLDQCRRLRDLLGDERFATYLSRANPGFARMVTALDRLGETKATARLDLWWMRRRDRAEIDWRIGMSFQERTELMAQLRQRAMGILGESRLFAYLDDEDGRWLLTNPRRRHVAEVSPVSRGIEPKRSP